MEAIEVDQVENTSIILHNDNQKNVIYLHLEHSFEQEVMSHYQHRRTMSNCSGGTSTSDLHGYRGRVDEQLSNRNSLKKEKKKKKTCTVFK
ncbi:hypothetical protein ACOSQ4_017870 [Xanthoceras sorbifolium]